MISSQPRLSLSLSLSLEKQRFWPCHVSRMIDHDSTIDETHVKFLLSINAMYALQGRPLNDVSCVLEGLAERQPLTVLLRQPLASILRVPREFW